MKKAKNTLQYAISPRTGPRMQQKALFIEQLATFLAGDSARKSMDLEMGELAAQEWRDLRQCTPLSGYPTHSEVVEILWEFLG